MPGDVTELSWQTEDADSVTIEPGIGAVALVGSTIVSPVETTTYTMTATGVGGTTTAQVSVAVSYPAPLVDFSATPSTILSGQPSILSWSSQYADTVSIDQDIGLVEANGSLEVSPVDSITYRLTAIGPGGSVSAEVAIAVASPAPQVHIISPVDGAALGIRSTTVSGTVTPADAVVLVNGTSAYVSDGHFLVENLPLIAGLNTILVEASANGHHARESIAVHVPDLDLAPLHVDLVAFNQDDQSLKTSGLVRVTVVNQGVDNVEAPYQIVLFEDLNLNGRFDSVFDNRLAVLDILSGPIAGGSTDEWIDFMGQMSFRDNRLGVFLDSANTIEEADETNNLAFIARQGQDLSASFLRVDTSDCPRQVLLQVRLGNSGTVGIPSGVPVSFYAGDPQSSGALIGTVFSTRALEPGAYEDLAVAWTGGASMQPVSAVADDDGAGQGVFSESDEGNNATTASNFICSGSQALPDSISGLVVDALTGAALDGAQISLQANLGDGTGAVIQQMATQADGSYLFPNLAPGEYVVSTFLDGYIDAHRTISLGTDEAAIHQNMALSPMLDVDEIRIVLTWAAQPSDLDAHLTGPNPDGCRFHLNYWHPQIPGANLDIDAVQGFGPETVTLVKGREGTYRYYVHDFSDRFFEGRDLSESGALVAVYFGSGEPALTFDIPHEPGTVWHVFNIDGPTGQLTPVNRMAFQTESGKIDFPVITSDPDTSVTLGQPYIYDLAANDPDLDSITYTLLEGPPGMTLDAPSGRLQWLAGDWQSGKFDVFVQATDGRCGEDTQRFVLNATAAPAATLTVTPCSGFNPGGQITLAWTTQRAETVIIHPDSGPDIGPVAANGSLTLDSPETPTAFTLTATNILGQTIDAVPHLPTAQIDAHSSSDGNLVLTWSSGCAVACSLAPDIGEVPCSGSMVVEPGPDYALTARNGAGSTTVVSPHIVGCEALDIDFSVMPVCSWSPSDPVTLTIEGNACAVYCDIDQGVGAVSCTGSVEVRPSESMAYTLTATGQAGDTITRAITAPHIVPLIDFFKATKRAIQPGESVALYWGTNCTASNTIDGGVGAVDGLRSVTVTPDQLPKTYTLTATAGSQTDNRSVTILQDQPPVSFYATPAVIKAGESSALVWSVGFADTCRIDPDIGAVSSSGRVEVQPSTTTTYTLTAEGPGGITTRDATVSFVAPMVRILAEPDLLLPGQSTTLTWIFSNADTCRIDPGIGEVALGGSMVVTPDKSTVYTISATGPGGYASASVAVSIYAPTVSMRVDPESVAPGQSATLSWSSTLADRCVISPDIGDVPTSGSTVVASASGTTYTIAATGPGGTSRASVTVGCLEPTIDFGPAVQSIQLGETVTLAWNVMNAETIRLDPVGSMPASGSLPVSPTETTVYTISVPGCGNEVTASAAVQVDCPPALSLLSPSGSGNRANTGFLVQWSDADCNDNARIDLYWDTDGSGSDGNLIVAGLQEDLDDSYDQYLWDTSALPEGAYFIYAVIDDGNSPPTTVYADAPVIVDRSVLPFEEILLTPNDRAAFAEFGKSVSIWGEFAAIGAPGDDEAGIDAGAVYLFKRIGRQWVEQTKLTPPFGDSAAFGASLALNGDDLIVGAPHWGYGASGVGAAYLFRRQGEEWVRMAELTPDMSFVDFFGSSVAVEGDKAYIGASHANLVYVFAREDQNWTQTAVLMPPEGYGDFFGFSLSCDGENLIAGTNVCAACGGNIDGAYIFYPDIGGGAQEARLSGSDWQPGDLFGYAVHIQGGTAIVGGMAEKAYLFERNAGGQGWDQTAILAADDGVAGNHFGSSVRLDSDHAYVSAASFQSFDPWMRVWGSQYGAEAVYVFRNQGNAWHQQYKLTLGDNILYQHFGQAIDTDNGYLIVGSPGESQDGVNTGVVHLFTTCDAELTAAPEAISAGGATVLTWKTTLADTCIIEPDIGAVATQGSLTLSPIETTTYHITASGPYGCTHKQVTVWVGDQTPTVSLTAAPAVIDPGQTTVLSWGSTFAASATIEPDIGPVDTRGAMVVAPQQSTTYTISATGPGGMSQAAADVVVSIDEPMASLSADPVSLSPGQGTTLTWSTAHATSVRIDPDIGAVAASGTIGVTPDGTTTYILTAANALYTTTAEATVAVEYLQPAAHLQLSPSTISPGESALLSWTSENAVSLSIDNAIGPVAAAGSTTVSPATTTTYTLTATGADGTAATDSETLTVAYRVPEVTITAQPTSISPGQSASLTWITTDATSVSIDNGIGTVASSGSVTVTPAATTTYAITAIGPGGTAYSDATVTVLSPITLVITSPLSGDLIDRPSVLVTGQYSNAEYLETGIMVNGIAALVDGNQFAANHIPLEPGDNTVTVQATDTAGHTAEASVAVEADLSGQHIHIGLVPESGAAPLDTAMTISSTVELQNTSVGCSGPDEAAITARDITSFDLALTIPGLYFITVQAWDNMNNLYSDTAAVQVLDRTTLDNLLQAKWNAMKACLAAGDIDGALNDFDSETKPIFEYHFRALQDHLGEVVAGLKSATLVKAGDNLAEYNLEGEQDGQAFSFYLLFEKDSQGIWRLKFF